MAELLPDDVSEVESVSVSLRETAADCDWVLEILVPAVAVAD